MSPTEARAFGAGLSQDGIVKLNSILLGLSLVAILQAQSAPAPNVVTLEQAIQEALAKNLDLAAEKLNISVAETREITARLRPNPVLTVSGQTLNLLGAAYNPDTPFGPNQMNIHTDFPMERGRKRYNRIAVAKEEKSLAELGVREVMRQVIASVQNGFVDVQQAKLNLRLAQDNLKSLEALVTINETRLRAGEVARVELDRSRVASFQYRAAVQQAQLQLGQATTQLQQLMGRRTPTLDFDVVTASRRDAVVPAPVKIAKLALTRRPDYLTRQQAQVRSQADIRLQIANGKVDYSVGTEFTRQSAWGISGNSIGLYFSVPLAIYNRNQGEIARAQRELGLNRAREVSLESAIRTEVNKAYQQYSITRQLLTSLESDMLARAQSVRDTTEFSYRRGEASLVEFLDAQRAFNDAMQTYNDASSNYLRSVFLIDTVTAETVSGS